MPLSLMCLWWVCVILLHFWLPTRQPAFFLHSLLQNHPPEGFSKSPWHVRWYYIHGKSRLWYTRISIYTYTDLAFFNNVTILTVWQPWENFPNGHLLRSVIEHMLNMWYMFIFHFYINSIPFPTLHINTCSSTCSTCFLHYFSVIFDTMYWHMFAMPFTWFLLTSLHMVILRITHVSYYI